MREEEPARSGNDKEDGPRYNFMIPDFSQRVRLYLKPKGHSTTCTFVFVIIDLCLCWLFLVL